MVEFIIIFLVCYVWHALGVTVGYHRLLSHRAFACPKAVEYFWVLAGYLSFEGSPIWWSTIHRAHHRHVDTPLDPHSPKHVGIREAHVGWLTHEAYPAHINPETQAKDLIKDPIYRFLEQGGVWMRAHALAMTLCIAFRVVLLLCFGWVPALASLLAALLVLQIPLLLNVFCHIPKLGYKNYATDDDSVNIWWVALFSMGEGWHNNHHASPGSAKTGMAPWEFDMSWQTIKLMRALGLVTRANVCTHEQLIRQAESHALKASSQKRPSLTLAEQLPTIAVSVNQSETIETPIAAPSAPNTTPEKVAILTPNNVHMLPNALSNAVPIKQPGTPVSLPLPPSKLVSVPVSLAATRRDRKLVSTASYRMSR
jgi:Fatty-acid desaturase